MRSTAPVAAAQCSAIGCQPAKRGGHSDRAAGVGADGSYSGAFLHAGRRTAGGATGKRAGIVGPHAQSP